MAAKKSPDRAAAVVAEVEKIAKQLRSGLRKQVAAFPKELDALAGKLRKQAAAAAGHVEDYVHELRVELEKSGKPARKKAAGKKAAR